MTGLFVTGLIGLRLIGLRLIELRLFGLRLFGLRLVGVGLVGLAIAGCDDEPDLPEDPELRVPGVEVPEPAALPPGVPAAAMAMPAEPEEFDPPLAVPGHDPLPDPPAPPMLPPGTMQPAGAPLPLSPGFMPDPIVQQGAAGGPVDASAAAPGAGCTGHIAQQPNHVLQVTAPFSRLRIVVSSRADTTLMVRGPDGSVRCVDDTNGDVNPVLEGAFAPGPHTVFVGTYQPGAPAAYVIGFTELAQVTPQTLAQQAPSAPPSP